MPGISLMLVAATNAILHKLDISTGCVGNGEWINDVTQITESKSFSKTPYSGDLNRDN